MQALEAIISLLPSLISAGASFGESAYNIAKTEQTNEANRQFSLDMTNKQWKRDDTSLQRQVNDAKLAGLSPLAVTGSMNSSSPVGYTAQAPQMDLSGLIGSMASASQLLDKGFDRSLTREEDEEQTRQFEKNLKEQARQFDKNLGQLKDQFEATQITSLKQFNSTMLYNYSRLKSENWATDSANIVNLSNQSLEIYKQVCQSLGVSPEIEYVDDLNSYKSKMNTFMAQYEQALRAFNGQFVTRSTSVSTGHSENAGGSAGVSVKPPFDTGVSVNAAAQVGTSESASSTESYDQTPHLKSLIINALNGVKFPLYRPSVANSPSTEFTALEY